ncbi:unnamed protein product [Lactuca saligna]|uniref:Uncharacterized protein n=1 Tax=Lactuca saligna TaxID=75948 RepID=A0AA36EMQ1_LACSI|nr:unnamed protein product [Lactuca saligna]
MNLGIEDFFNYVKSCPLLYAFCDFPNPFYPKQVCELYYSCFVDSSAQTISSTIGDGESRKSMYVPYPCFLGLILACDEDGYNIKHEHIIPIPAFSSKIIIVAPSVDANDEEEVDDEEDELATNKGEASFQGLNYLLRLKKHIRFSSTSSSTPSADDIVQHGSTASQVEIVDPLIQDVISPRSLSPSLQATTFPPMPTPLQIASFD